MIKQFTNIRMYNSPSDIYNKINEKYSEQSVMVIVAGMTTHNHQRIIWLCNDQIKESMV